LNDEPTNLTFEQLEQRLSRQPFSPLFARLAYEYLNQNRVEDAKQLCVKGLNLYPTYSTARLILELCYRVESTQIITQPESIIDTTPENLETEFTTAQNEIDSNEEAIVDDIDSDLLTSPGLHIHEVSVEEVQNISEPEQIISIKELPDTGTSEPIPDSLTLKNLDETEHLLTEGIYNTHSNEITGKTVDLLPAEDNIETEKVHNAVEEDRPIVNEQTVDTMEPVSEYSVPTETASVEDILQEDLVNDLSPEADSNENIDKINVDELNLIGGDNTALNKDDTQKSIQDYARPIISKTLAEIYASQGEYREAIETYSILMKIRPARKKEIAIRIRELEEELSKTRSEQG
jgi:tetratricopeptide (TPR) repeat protein